MLYKWFILLTIIVNVCNGQEDNLFPQKTTQDVFDVIAKTPLVTFTMKTSADIVAAIVRSISWGPSIVTRILGIGNVVPFIVNENNIVGSIDKFVDDFETGLGNEDAHMAISSIIPKYGHPFESHEVVTGDGYILSLNRIPGNGSVVFLMHGLLGSSDDYVIAGPEDGLAYLLAREGYDVWMGNARGNKNCRRHVQFTPNEASFWDFSWHEIGIFDLPAMIDYALETSNQTSLKYIGHSQGSTAFFVMASERPEYNEKISLMIALSPVAFMSNARSPIVRLLAPGTPVLHGIAQSFGVYEFLPDDNMMKILKIAMCGTGAISQIVCSNIIFMVAGFSYEHLNFTNLPVMLGHTPSGASIKQFVHYGQSVISGEFRKYDYGSIGNLEKYGSTVPPSYPVENVTAPVSLFYSDNDWLAHPEDIDLLYNKLNNAIDIHKIPAQHFNHLDFLFAKDFKLLVYKRIRKLMNHF